MPDSTTPTRDWLAEAIRAAHRPDCGWCRSGDRTCPEHAAEAVQDVVEQARAEGRHEVQRMVAAEAYRIDQSGGMVSAAWVADGLRHIALYGCPGPRATGKSCVHKGSGDR